MLRVALPVLVRATPCEGLPVFSSWLPKERLDLERLTAGAEEFEVVKLQVGPAVV